MYLNVFISLFFSLSSSMSSSVCCRLTLKKNRKIDITLQDYTEQCFFFIDSCKYKRPPYIHYRLAQYKCTVFTTHVCRIPRTPLLSRLCFYDGIFYGKEELAIFFLCTRTCAISKKRNFVLFNLVALWRECIYL